MLIKFYVNGAIVDTYKCDCKSVDQLSAEDQEAIAKIKSDAFRNFGYPVLTEIAYDTMS
jgi:hypothetical protein